MFQNFSFLLKSERGSNLFFILLFFIVFFVLDVHKTLFYPPQSIHIWRQTNCLSLTQNYYQDDLPFFEPQMHNQFCDNGYSGRAVGEFPVIYYFVAQLWKLFGKHEWIFKLVQLVFLFSGLFFLFLSLKKLLKNQFWSGFISLLLFTSPMVVYYGQNFLPDVPALSFVFIAWYFVLKYRERKKQLFLWGAAFFFCLSILLKITSALSFIALGGWVIYELLFLKKEKRIFDFKLLYFVPFLLTIFIAGAWYLYAEYYNNIHQGQFSYHGIWPLWKIGWEEIKVILDALDKIYLKLMFLPFTQYLTIGFWLILLFFIRKVPLVFRFLLIVLSLGFFSEIILWFQVLNGHDYYTINLLFVFVFVWTVVFIHLKTTRFYKSKILYSVAAVFFIVNLTQCDRQLKNYYKGWMNDSFVNNMEALREIEHVFQAAGIQKQDKVISIPDPSINASLYYMNRKGYTDFASDFSRQETFYARMEQGAKFLIINDTTLLKKEVILPFIKKPVGAYRNVRLYDLRDIKSE